MSRRGPASSRLTSTIGESSLWMRDIACMAFDSCNPADTRLVRRPESTIASPLSPTLVSRGRPSGSSCAMNSPRSADEDIHCRSRYLSAGKLPFAEPKCTPRAEAAPPSRYQGSSPPDSATTNSRLPDLPVFLPGLRNRSTSDCGHCGGKPENTRQKHRNSSLRRTLWCRSVRTQEHSACGLRSRQPTVDRGTPAAGICRGTSCRSTSERSASRK